MKSCRCSGRITTFPCCLGRSAKCRLRIVRRSWAQRRRMLKSVAGTSSSSRSGMATTPGTTANTASTPHLRRTLTLTDLILYGVIVIQPVAPMSVFGVLSDRGKGHVVTAILIAMVAMLFTGISYGRMARAYPSAGSAFTYVAQEVNPAVGFVTGWSMVMDYMLNPLICTIWCAQQSHE